MKITTQLSKPFFWLLTVLLLQTVALFAQPCTLNVSLVKTNPTCHGDCDGSITANVTNGNGTYSYMWSNGETTATISNLCAGAYSVMVTEMGTQCMDSASTALSKGAVGGNVVVTNTSGCGLCDGSITATGNGGNGAPYTYMWNTGATTAMIGSLCPGTYTVTITDHMGCTFVCTKHVGVNGAGAFTLGETIVHDTSCVAGQCSGSINVSPNPGPASAYTFAWSNGATTSMITALCAGAYTVTATNGSGCTMSETYMVGDSSDCGTDPCSLSVSIAKVNPTCHGDCDGSMTANVSNGSGNYSYAWSNGGTGSSIQNLCAGAYTVTVTDMNTQCTATMTQSVAKGAVGVHVTKQNATCGQCNGSITLQGNGGNGAPYTYVWSTGATTNVVDSLCPGTYTATITDNSGCTFICISTIINDTTGCDSVCNNDFTTYTQGGWGNPGAPGQYMAANFNSCLGGTVTIGDPCGFTLTLTSVQDVQDFLPQGGTPAALTQNYTNPGSGNITVLAGQMLAVHFALEFDACDANLSASPTPLAEQVYVDTLSPFYSWNIQAIHDTAMMVLAGCNSAYTPAEVNDALTAINENYDNGGNQGWFVCPDDFNRTTVPVTVKVKVYPNPFNESFTIDTKDQTGLRVTVSDITGKVLRTYENVSGIQQVSGNFGRGTYIITVENPRTGERQMIRTISIR